MSDLKIKEENKWEIASAILELIRNAIKTGIITKEEVEKATWD